MTTNDAVYLAEQKDRIAAAIRDRAQRDNALHSAARKNPDSEILAARASTADPISRALRDATVMDEALGRVRLEGQTLGLRAARATAYADARAGLPNAGTYAHPLASGIALRAALDSSTGLGLINESTRRVVDFSPHPTRLPALVDKLVVGSLRVHRAATGGYSGLPAATADGAALPSLSALVVSADEEIMLRRFGANGDLSREHYESGEIFRAAVDTLFRVEFYRALEAAMINGDGTGVNLPGVLSVSGTGAVAYTTGSKVAAVSAGVQSVQDAGFYDGELYAVARPATIRTLRDELRAGGSAGLADVMPEVAGWLPSPAVPAGTVLVGDWHNGAALLLHESGLELAVSPSHASNLTQGLVTLRAEAHLAFRVRQPAAFAVVTGL